MFKRIAISTVLISVLFAAGTSFAGGGQHYPNGAEGVFAGMLPPPGIYAFSYTLYYTADQFNDDNGDEYTTAPFADFDATIIVEAPRVVYMSKFEVLGGTLGAHTLIPIYIDTDLESLGFDDSGLGDIFVGPVIAWHKPPYHYAVGLDVVFPTGDFDAGNPASAGGNFWTIEPIFAFTYLLESNWCLSFKAMYDFNTKNDEYVVPGPDPTVVERDPGDEFHVDYSVDYGIADKWRVGVSGYFYKQVTDDEIDGTEIEDDLGQVLAIGPTVVYQPNPGFSVTFKAQIETLVENRPQGTSYWLKVLKAF